jgi:hypothetical protein
MESTSAKRHAPEQSAPASKKNKATLERLCASCHQPKRPDEFSKGQRKKGALACCKPCVALVRDPGVVGAKQQQGAKQPPPPQMNAKQKQMLCCFVCHVNKSIVSFNKKDRKQACAEPRCSECSAKDAKELDRQRREVEREKQAVEREKQAVEREKRETEQKEINRIAYLKESAMLAANGPQMKMPTFEVPGMGTLWGERDGYECPALVFHSSTTALESLLVGSYDLVFYCTHGDDDSSVQNRVTKGTLEFTQCVQDDEATGPGKITGTIAVDKSVKNSMYMHRFDSKITCESSSSCSFQVSNMDELENIAFEHDVTGTIQRVAKRQAVRYMPEGEDALDHQREYAQSIQFENATQAQSILDSYPCGNEPLLWLTNHMKFPVEVSRLVGGFATRKPPPIFFFEEDDLWLTFEWHEGHHGDGFGTNLVARRRR